MIRINGGSAWDPRFAVFVLAGQELTIQSESTDAAQMWEGDGQFLMATSPKGAPTGSIRPAGSTLKWRAPRKPGAASLVLKIATAEGNWVEAAELNVQIMAPINTLAGGVLEGYRIGRYPKALPSSEVAYTPPAGFLKIPTEAASIPVSPRFNLEDFACKQRHKGVRYVALEPRLLPFLEAIAARVEEMGFVCSTNDIRPAGDDHEHAHGTAPGRPITIMSGYRTPAYNASLGNVELSRHQYGDASDIIIDSDGDGSMDDLNRDGRVNGRDALTLAAWIEDIWTRPEFSNNPGGLGVYNGTGSHGPFVHVDLRGKRTRWGGNGLEWQDIAVNRAGAATLDHAEAEGPSEKPVLVAEAIPAPRPAVKRPVRSAAVVVQAAAVPARAVQAAAPARVVPAPAAQVAVVTPPAVAPVPAAAPAAVAPATALPTAVAPVAVVTAAVVPVPTAQAAVIPASFRQTATLTDTR